MLRSEQRSSKFRDSAPSTVFRLTVLCGPFHCKEKPQLGSLWLLPSPEESCRDRMRKPAMEEEGEAAMKLPEREGAKLPRLSQRGTSDQFWSACHGVLTAYVEYTKFRVTA